MCWILDSLLSRGLCQDTWSPLQKVFSVGRCASVCAQAKPGRGPSEGPSLQESPLEGRGGLGIQTPEPTFWLQGVQSPDCSSPQQLLAGRAPWKRHLEVSMLLKSLESHPHPPNIREPWRFATSFLKELPSLMESHLGHTLAKGTVAWAASGRTLSVMVTHSLCCASLGPGVYSVMLRDHQISPGTLGCEC